MARINKTSYEYNTYCYRTITTEEKFFLMRRIQRLKFSNRFGQQSANELNETELDERNEI